MDNQVLLNKCFLRLHKRIATHPQLSTMWIEYLTNKYPEPTIEDIRDCMNALENMSVFPDIHIKQAQALYGISSILFNDVAK